ncbi:MAG: class I SAM-dependent methyltransferase [Candidatus Thiodiazotropha sp.]
MTKSFECYGLDRVNYERCTECGCVHARTLLDLSEAEWGNLCRAYHGGYRGQGVNPHDPRASQRLDRQAEVLLALSQQGMLPTQSEWLDFGCGEGELLNRLNQSGLRVSGYDPYWDAASHLSPADLLPGRFPVVLNTATLEHLRDRESLDRLGSLVSDHGVLALHTLVRGEIPSDPDWFYLLPVHTLMFTNRAMSLLFEQWSFDCSLYAIEARLWLWFRQPRLEALQKIILETHRLEDWKTTRGFLAYWP